MARDFPSLGSAVAVTPAERLDQVVDDALRACCGDLNRAIAVVSDAVGKDAELARVVFARMWDLAIANVVRARVATRRSADRFQPHQPVVVGEIKPSGSVQSNSAVVTLSPTGSRHPLGDDSGSPSRSPVRGTSAAHRPAGAMASESRRPAMPRTAPAALLAAARLAARTILDTHKTEDGRLLGDCSKADLRRLAESSRRRGDFYAALAGMIPDEGVVRAHARGEDVQTLWDRHRLANATEEAV